MSPDLSAPTVDLHTAADVLGIGRSTAYKLASAGDFPAKVIRAGRRYRVVSADLRRLISVDDAA
ncbi:helix-turn-helix transcriptional regulator [Nocardia carnea]|uniref:helix-turn-helix transcriptional regulator n=1 Tax=Nocardia carnea TaxID=37328 RepID=UPI002458E5CD|nr:helix-turn-helix domain-containing protein [Nocardia carnea]